MRQLSNIIHVIIKKLDPALCDKKHSIIIIP